MHRARSLRNAPRADAPSVIGTHDLDIPCDAALGEPEILAISSETLGELGIRTKRRGNVLGAASPWWAVVGSPLFHWALFTLIIVIFVSIGILVTVVFCITSVLDIQVRVRIATMELARVQAALDEYKAHNAASRPDNLARSPLYFEFKSAIPTNVSH